MKLLVNLVMDHNHNPLIYGFLLSFIMFAMGMIMGFLSRSGTDLQSQLVVTVVAILMVGAGIIILRRTFKLRDNCPICKNKYHFGKKKDVL